MRACNSGYDARCGGAITDLLDALRRAHAVDFADRDVIVDGKTIASHRFESLALAWDGTADGLEEFGWEAAAEALRDEEAET